MTQRARPLTIYLLCLLAVAAAAATARWQAGHLDRMLGTDEADYVRAMSYGAVANYLGTHERSGFAFTAQVVDEYRQTGWARPFTRDWSAGDAAGLRHYHPPLALYPVGVLAGAGVTDEGTLRLVPLLTGVLACVAAAMLAFLLLEGTPASVRLPMAVAAGLLIALSPYHIEGSLAIGPHAAFSLFATITLVALTRAVQSADPRWWIGACAAFGLTTLTVPYWALLVPAALWACWALGPGSRSARLLVGGTLVAVAAAAVAWPPLLYGAAFVKPALMYAGIVVNPLVEGRTPGVWLVHLAQAHPLLTVLTFAGVAAAPALGRERLRAFAPAVIFVLGFMALNLRVGHMKALYASDVLAPLAALACALTGGVLVRAGRAAAPVLALGIVVLAPALAWASADMPREAPGWRPPLQALNDRLSGERILVTPRPAGAMMTYYLTGATTVLDSSDPADVAALNQAIAAGEIDVVLRWGGSIEPGGAAGAVVKGRSPEGTTAIGGTVVSWWRVDRVTKAASRVLGE